MGYLNNRNAALVIQIFKYFRQKFPNKKCLSMYTFR